VSNVISLDSQFLRGSYPPILTPFRSDGEVDYETYVRLVQLQIDGGSHGIVVNGTTAEPSLLTLEERKKILEVALDAAGGRLPVVAATGSQNLTETCALTEHAERAGAAAVLVVTPYYVRGPQRGVAAYFNELGQRTTLPLLLYHIPGRAAFTVSLDTLEQIAEKTPHFVGIKHASPDLTLVTEVLDKFGPEFRVLVGLEELTFPMLALGAAAIVSAIGNIAPRPIAALYEAMARGDLATGRRLHYELFDLNRAVFFDTNPIPLKYMAKRLGILDDNCHRLPMMPASTQIQKKLDEILHRARSHIGSR
jgi:4-hydroxy-tetrahydrodipicolinate synthase